MEYESVKKFKSMSAEQKMERIYSRALMSLQRSIDTIYSQPPEMQEKLKEYKACVEAEIDYLATLTGDDPSYLYPHDEA